MPAKLRLLLIGHTYAALENRKKIQALAAHFDLVCVTSTTEQRIVLGRPASDFDNESDAAARAYELVRLERRGGSDTTFRYAGLGSLMRSRVFDVVLVENEPWAVVCWQARLLTGLFQPGARFGIFTWENMLRPGWKGLVLEGVYRAMTATTDFIIAGNMRAREIVIERGARPEAVEVAAQLGVDLANHQPASAQEKRLERARSGLPEEGFIVGYCGRLTPEKGIHELLAACDRLNTAGGPALHLAILGAGVMKPWLEEQAVSRAWLHLLPPRPHFEIPGFMRALDVFVLASKPVRSLANCWEEQFGHVLIEAMACGVATVGSSSGAIPEVIAHPEAVFPWGEMKPLASILRGLQGDAAAAARLAGSQRAHTRLHYTHEAVAARWAAFIHAQFGLKLP